VDFEDLLLAVQPPAPPPGAVALEKEAHAAFFTRLRGHSEIAIALRRLFETHALLTVEPVGEDEEARRHHALAGGPAPLTGLDPAMYLRMRRGEKARGVKLRFELPKPEVLQIYADHVKDAPAQEKEVYRDLFVRFVDEERLPRLVQDFRAAMKHRAEVHALQEAWASVAHALDRGHQEGAVLAVAPGRGARVIVAWVADRDTAPRVLELELKAENFEETLDGFLNGAAPVAVAFSGEGVARAAGQRIVRHLRRNSDSLRSVLVPPGAGRTLLREVARRPSEALLSQDERHAFLLGWLTLDPRAVALHTPHVIRSFVPLRAEVNPRLLEEFEALFLRELLLNRGVDVNSASVDSLRRVPGVDGDGVAAERSTAPFRSLEDFQARMAIAPREARAAYCLLRVRGGDDPLDGARFLHPEFRPALRRALEAGGAALEEVLRETARLDALPWEATLRDVADGEGVYARIREALLRGGRRRPNLRRHAEVRRLETLQKGDRLKGVVKSLAEYGAFVDIGASRPGLVHVSHLVSDRFIKDPSEVLQIGQEVEVRVLEVDLAEQRMRFSLLTEEQEAQVAERMAARRAEREGGGRPPHGEQGSRSPRGDGPPRGDRGSRGDRGARGDRPNRGERNDRGPRRDQRRSEDVGPDPRAHKEEIDPTNPFFQFFQQKKSEK
jgi:transcriptional accessory protein Tex/SPT6